jgi:hypothetical protein
MVGQRVVDRFDLRIIQECLVVAIAAGDTEARGDARRTVGIARGHAKNNTAVTGDDRGNDAFDTDVSGTEDSPFDLACDRRPSREIL